MNERGLCLRASGLQKTYTLGAKELTVLRDLDFSAEPGEQVGIIGASGAGKSTLLHLLGGLDEPNRGQIYWDGGEISRLPDHKLSRLRNEWIGFVFQFHHLLPEFDAAENVAMPLYIAGTRRGEALAKARELLAEVGLAERMGHRPAELSGGEQQRVAIARALIRQPRLLLVDEPTGNLDSVTGEMVIELLFRLARQRQTTMLIVTHNEGLARRLSRVAKLKDGLFLGQESAPSA